MALNGKVMPSDINMAKPMSALGIAVLMAAGAAIYEALAVNVAKMTTEPVDKPNAMPADKPIKDKKKGVISANVSKRHFFQGIGDKVSAAVKPISNKNNANTALNALVNNSVTAALH